MRPFGVAGGTYLGVSVLSAWTLSGAPLAATDLWSRFARSAGADVLIDQGIPKSATEWLLVGHAYSDVAVPHLAVSVEIGGCRKTLNVVGDRTWRDGVPTAPAPFTKMPLDWARAYGGAGFAANPFGKGYGGLDLPNIEIPGQMIRSSNDRPAPACFRAYPIDGPQRTSQLGTYDQRWLETEFPGFPSDIDWRVHNLAPEDQRRENPFAAGERVVLHHLVEGSPRVELRIPDVAARCFTYREPGDLREVALELRTLWLLPDEDMLVLVFQGSRLIGDMLGSDIGGVIVGLDASDRRREIAHFQQALARRLDLDVGAAEMLDDRPLMPEGLAFPDFLGRAEDLTMPDRTGALEANLYAGAELRRQRALELFAEAGYEGGEELFPRQVPPTRSQAPLAEQMRQASEEATRQRARAEAKLGALRERALDEMRALGVDPAGLERPRPGPPPVLAATHLATMQRIVSEARAAGRPLEAFERQLDDPEFHRDLFEKEARGREMYRRSAHRTEGLPESDLDRIVLVREQVEEAIHARSSLERTDLTAAELGELDLSGMDLSGAWLEGANLSGCNLSGAKLDGAVLAKANLGDAILCRTSLRRANLGNARLVWTSVEGCDLDDAVLAGADVRGATFTCCNLRGADLSEIRVEGTRFLRSDLSNVTFLKMKLGDTRFESCGLDGTSFLEADLTGASFEGCRMTKTVFVTCTAEQAIFANAIIDNARFVSSCRFEKCDFRGAQLSRSTLRACSFAESSFVSATLDDSDLSAASFVGAHMYRATLRRALATECDLRGAILTGANLMFAVLQGSDIRGADIRGANLFSTDLALVHADSDTRLDGSLVSRARHRPLRKEVT